MFEECRDLGIMGFEFMDKGNAVGSCVNYSGRMHLFNEDNMWNLIRSTYVAENYNEGRLREINEAMCSADNLNIYLRSKSLEGQVEEVAEWYQTKHNATAFSEELLAKINKPNCTIKDCKIDLPPPNVLIPKNFDILP